MNRDRYEYIPGRYLHRGDRFRVSGGTLYRNQAGELKRVGLRGVFEFRGIVTQGRRVYVDALLVTRHGYCGQYLLFHQGRPYRHPTLPGIIMRPYTIRRLTERTQNRAGLPTHAK